MTRFKTTLATLAVVAISGFGFMPAMAAADDANSVNIYSYRQEFLIRPFLDEFTKETGIPVKVVFAKKGVLERLKAEAQNTPADLILTVDIARLSALVEAGLTQAVASDVLDANIPAHFRQPEGHWYGLTSRARVLFVSKDRVGEDEITTYEDLADPKWKGRLCMRSSRHPYNRAWMASMIAAHGEDGATKWAKGLMANMARNPQGNDRGQVKAIKEGLCDIGVGNQYYYGKMKFNKKKPEQQAWAAAVRLVYPNQADRGVHVNISGIAMTKHAKHPAEARKLMEFLSSKRAQQMYASTNFEYPVMAGIKPDQEVASWGSFKSDRVNLQTIADLSPKATMIFQTIGMP
jgi:iron(III) transport system substrate-binding protein